jgi:peptidyl-prolyl cis-trans isomerase SurA
MSSKNILLFLVMISLIIMAGSDIKAADAKELNKKVIAKVNDEEITFGELNKAYRKNLNREELELYQVNHDSLMSFLDLYINYRLKVQDALAHNYDENMEVMQDIKQNRKMLAESFFYDSHLIKPNVDELLQKRKEELLISIILFKLDPTGNPAFNKKVFEKAKIILDSINNGGDFAYFAKTYSEDPSTGQNGGMIPSWITSGKVQRQMEDVVYKLQAGEVYNDIVKTNYGYFIIKVNKREPRKLVLAAHILIQTLPDADSTDQYARVDSIAKAIRKNGNFEEVAKELSADTQSGAQGGSFGEYYSRSTGFEKNGKNVFGEVETAIFDLKDGEISGPIKSMIGYHIIKRLATKDANLLEEYDQIKKIYKKLYYAEDSRKLLDEMKKKYGFKINQTIKNHFLENVNNARTTIDSAWDAKLDKNLYDKIFFQIQDYKVTLGQFVKEMNTMAELRGKPLNEIGLQQSIDELVDPEVFYYATKNLEKENEEFADLMREFRDGILLFKVEAERVWDKLRFDSTLARKFYDTTSMEFTREKMYDLTEVYVLVDNIADSVYLEIKDGADIEKIAKDITVRPGYREKKGHLGLVSSMRNPVARIVDEKGLKVGDISRPFQIESGYSVVRVNKIEEPRKKTFEEAIPDLAPLVQDLLQQKLTSEWLAELKEKFDVVIYEDVIKETVSEYKGK